MESLQAQTDNHCAPLRPIRDREGRTHFGERPRIVRELDNLWFADRAGTSTHRSLLLRRLAKWSFVPAPPPGRGPWRR